MSIQKHKEHFEIATIVNLVLPSEHLLGHTARHVSQKPITLIEAFLGIKRGGKPFETIIFLEFISSPSINHSNLTP